MAETLHIAVVGRGLWGAAAARHLARAGHRVTLIGPDEPPVPFERHDGVFASHYDEGRITRVLDADPVWSELAEASIDRYRAIERDGGVAFFSEVGALMVGDGGSPWVKRVARTAATRAVRCERLDGDALARRFPMLAFQDEARGFHEPARAGHVSPRALVAAQTACAVRAGAALRPAIATRVRETAGGVAVETARGTVRADRAVVAAGAYAPHLVEGAPPLRVFARTVTFFALDEAEAARLSAMPSIVWRNGADDPYILPPVRYGDGRLWLKIGGNPTDELLETPKAISGWFRSGGDTAVCDHLEALLRSLVPGLRFEARAQRPCVTAFTASGRPLVASHGPRITLAYGGCGAGAKCSDEVGRLAARCALGDTDPRFAPSCRQAA